MSENKLETLIKISDLKAKKNIEINRITYKNFYLVPCKVSIKEEEVNFTYDMDYLECLSEIRKRKTIEKLRIAINISNLFQILDEYSFNLNPNNLYFDYNYNVKVLERDIRLYEEVIDYEDMLIQYKSIIGYIFNDKHSYEDFYNGGMDLIKSDKIIKTYLSLDNVDEIKNALLTELKNQEQYERDNYIEVKLKNVKIKKYSMIAMGITILGLGIYTVYNTVFLNPLYKNTIKADNYFMEQDYEGVINALESTRGLTLEKESKYRLAYSYIRSENLSEFQKKNILANLNVKSDENILDYWIALGKSQYDEAIDLAKKVQDDELVLFALLNKDKYIQDNDKLTGEEKQKEQEAIKSDIENLTKELNGTDTLKTNTVNGSLTNGSSTNASNPGTENDKDSSSASDGLNLVPSSN